MVPFGQPLIAQGIAKMSIALDAALFLREQKESNPLTLSERGLLFTLLFRVGSNPFSWVSQETLCIELDLADSNLRSQLKKIVDKGFIEIMKDPNDKRKNLYRPADFLINYHQLPNRTSSKKYRSKSGGNLRDTARNQAVNTARNQAVLSKKKSEETLEPPKPEKIKNFPKGNRNNKKENKSNGFVTRRLITQKSWSSRNKAKSHESVETERKPRSKEAQKAWLEVMSKVKGKRLVCE